MNEKRIEKENVILAGEHPIYPENTMVQLDEEVCPLGIKRGTINRISSIHACGATTLAIKAAMIIVEKYKGSALAYDLDNSISRDRTDSICKDMSIPETCLGEPRLYVIDNKTTGISFDQFMSIVNSSCNNKLILEITELTVIIVDTINNIITPEYDKTYSTELEKLKDLLYISNTVMIFTDHLIQTITIPKYEDVEDAYGNRVSRGIDNEIVMRPHGKDHVDITVSDKTFTVNRLDDTLFDKEEISKIIV